MHFLNRLIDCHIRCDRNRTVSLDFLQRLAGIRQKCRFFKPKPLQQIFRLISERPQPAGNSPDAERSLEKRIGDRRYDGIGIGMTVTGDINRLL